MEVHIHILVYLFDQEYLDDIDIYQEFFQQVF